MCPLIYRDAAYVSANGTQRPIPVLAFGGCPFRIDDITVNKNMAIREPTVLGITATGGRTLQLDQESALPFAVTDDNELRYVGANLIISTPDP
jgi:hypothetical protein